MSDYGDSASFLPVLKTPIPAAEVPPAPHALDLARSSTAHLPPPSQMMRSTRGRELAPWINPPSKLVSAARAEAHVRNAESAMPPCDGGGGRWGFGRWCAQTGGVNGREKSP